MQRPETARGVPTFAAEEIDLCLGLLVDADGRTLGGTLDVEQLDGNQLGQLVLEDMIEMSESGWQLSARGQLFSDLLDSYAQATFAKVETRARDSG